MWIIYKAPKGCSLGMMLLTQLYELTSPWRTWICFFQKESITTEKACSKDLSVAEPSGRVGWQEILHRGLGTAGREQQVGSVAASQENHLEVVPRGGWVPRMEGWSLPLGVHLLIRPMCVKWRSVGIKSDSWAQNKTVTHILSVTLTAFPVRVTSVMG